MTASSAYRVENLSVAVDRRQIVRNISFSLESGASLAIIGPNGAGKSTLLKSLLRLLSPASGRILLFGMDLQDYTHRELAKQIAYVPQAGSATMPFTAGEFVLMARYAYLNPFSHFTDTDRDIAEKAMTQAGVAELGDRALHTLSGGERQKVYIAAALAQQPRVLLLDEATSSLDYRHQVDLLDLIGRLRAETGMTVVSVTHDLNQGVLNYDAVLALKAGQSVFWGTADRLLDSSLLKSVYDTPFRFLHDPDSGSTFIVPGGRSL